MPQVLLRRIVLLTDQTNDKALRGLGQGSADRRSRLEQNGGGAGSFVAWRSEERAVREGLIAVHARKEFAGHLRLSKLSAAR